MSGATQDGQGVNFLAAWGARAQQRADRATQERRGTQDGWDWPNGCGDENWPRDGAKSGETDE
jgi:hypothetical protein